MALKYALYQTHSTIHIFTDSLSALQVLRRTQATDNLRLISTVLFHIRQLKEQEKILTFWWIPSHVNITGNDLADTAAKNSLKNLLVTGHIPPSLSQLKKHVRRAAYETLLIEHRAWVIAGSPSASWYKIVTECNPPFLVNNLSRNTAAIFHRLRLGYRCNWEIDMRVPKPCTLCDTITQEPLIHYVLDCPSIQHLRPRKFHSNNRQDESHFASTAARCLVEMLSLPDSLLVFTRDPPPR
nr:uncharacterized protein LOC113808154 [Penaeus vannamei]